MEFGREGSMRILVGMSGGLDSTYAARLLIDQGHEVVGAVLRMHEYTECDAALESCRELGIPLVTVNCTEEFDRVVKDNFVCENSRGRTPNPCIICNERVKFKCLYDYAKLNEFDKIATGHYAGIKHVGENRTAVSTARDSAKDQSYMLYRLPKEILDMLLLPLSNLTKEEVRIIASKNGLTSAERAESQEICFLPDGGHAEYIESRLGKFPEGEFVDESGRVLGTHKGIIRYTVGQRKGLGVSLGERAFVTDINVETNRITLSPSLSGKLELIISDVVYSGIAEKDNLDGLSLSVKTRYTRDTVTANAKRLSDGRIKLIFNNEVKAAPGQSAVAYLDDYVAFGGIIDA
jgi:tRNA-specific 2-thiouridylase